MARVLDLAKYQIYGVGRLRREHQAVCALYMKRLPSLNICEIPAIKGDNAQLCRAKEAQKLRKIAAKNSGKNSMKHYQIALDASGKNLSSEEFAQLVVTTSSTLDFFIGGADGLDDKFVADVDLVLSFGKMIFPHGLARIMLVEQIYRIEMILASHPYHKGHE